MSDFDFDVDDLEKWLDRLATEVPDAIPDALAAMSDVLIPRLRAAAPFNEMNSYETHLQDAIGKTSVKTSKRGTKYQVVFVKKRGENDKNVYKAVVAEYGRRGGETKDGKIITGIPARPFWRTTVNDCREDMLEAGKKVIEEVIKKINENRG